MTWIRDTGGHSVVHCEHMESTDWQANLLQEAPFVAVALDASLRIRGWSGAAGRMFGAEEAVGAEVSTRLSADDPGFWARLVATGAGRGVFAGRVIEWTATARRDADGRLEEVACYGREVGAEEVKGELERSLMRAIVDHLDIVVWAMQRDGVCTYHEGKAVGSVGLQAGTFVGKNLREMYAGASGAVFDRVFAGEVVYTDGGTHGQAFQSWMIPMRGRDGEVEMLVAASLDVTAQRQGEQELRDRIDQIEAQQRTIRELSTPIIEVWDRVLTLPILGMVDADRAAEIMDNLLQAVVTKRARFAILDLTGVKQIDTATAGHLLRLVRAIRLLGAEGVITGIHPNIAQTIVALGVELPNLSVHSTLREALGHCITRLVRR